jgi:YfiH family protein
MQLLDKYILPKCPFPSNIKAYCTTRALDNNSYRQLAPDDGFNVSVKHADISQLDANRAQLQDELQLPCAPMWLQQVHGTHIISLPTHKTLPIADGAITADANIPCAILTADCLPVLMSNSTGTQVGAIHAGWRSLAGGILRLAAERFDATDEVITWLGPAISNKHFEVGADILTAFKLDATDKDKCFTPYKKDKWLADIYALARIQLQQAGVNAIYGGEYCTFSDTNRFFSYRRDASSARMASIIWRI